MTSETAVSDLQRRFNIIDHALANMSVEADAIAEHFNEEGLLLGDGQWRVSQIYKHVRDIRDEFRSAVKALEAIDASPTPPAATEHEHVTADTDSPRTVADPGCRAEIVRHDRVRNPSRLRVVIRRRTLSRQAIIHRLLSNV